MTTETNAVPQAQVYRYEKPEFAAGRGKAIQKLGITDRAFVAVQRIRKGGETNLHCHTKVDGFWTVLSGRARFYTTDDVVIAELGPLEGVVIPRNFPYWFESASEDELELLQMEACSEELIETRGAGTGRVDLGPLRPNQLRKVPVPPPTT